MVTKEMMEERLPIETKEPVGELGTKELGQPVEIEEPTGESRPEELGHPADMKEPKRLEEERVEGWSSLVDTRTNMGGHIF